MPQTKRALEWLEQNHETLVDWLRQSVAIPSISTDGQHGKEISQTAALVCDFMRQAGLNNVREISFGESYPYSYGEWLGAPGKPTLFLYSHHDVQPVNYANQWLSDPWTLTRRDGRLFGRGSADDKAAFVAQLGAIAAWLKTNGSLPVNVKVLCEGEEEVGSRNLQGFFKNHRECIEADVVVVCDTENIEVGLPCITSALRGIVAAQVKVTTAHFPVHSGMAGGALADAAIVLSQVLARLGNPKEEVPVPGFEKNLKKLTTEEEALYAELPFNEAKAREDLGILPGVPFATPQGRTMYEQTWRHPSATVIAIEASSIKGASNQVLPTAEAIVSCRIVPNMDPEESFNQLKDFLEKDPPFGAKVEVIPHGPPVAWWATDPRGPAFTAAMDSLTEAFGKKAVPIGCGGTIGFVGPLVEILGGAPALLLGIEDPQSNAHAPNESLHEGDWKKLMGAMVRMFGKMGHLTPETTR
jgi:acetylornithine deacetylase/succinyl-diaminopimelate desuccinylase-like protein